MFRNKCGSHSHFADFDKCEILKCFARREISSGTPAVHVLHELVERMESMGAPAEQRPEEQETGHIHDELAEFDSSQEDGEGASASEFAEAIEGSSATHFINNAMRADEGERVHVFYAPQGEDFRPGRMM